jgi:toxin ParE1/3/4
MNWALSSRARLDIQIILGASAERFGLDAGRRYRLLLERAIEDVATDPGRPGVSRPSDDLRLYHIRHSRSQTGRGRRVQRARHVIVFRIRPDRIEVLRVLHDAMDLPARLSEL